MGLVCESWASERGGSEGHVDWPYGDFECHPVCIAELPPEVEHPKAMPLRASHAHLPIWARSRRGGGRHASRVTGRLPNRVEEKQWCLFAEHAELLFATRQEG